jgi:hypothetical protein
MPPQGGALADEQIAAIVNYVRSSWGGSGKQDQKAVTVAQVKTARATTANRNEKSNDSPMWSQEELLREWPLPVEKGPLNNLVVSLYKGVFNEMPDFSRLQADAVEEEPRGFVDLASLGEKDHYAAVWEGDFEVKKDGDYTFRIDSDDGSRLFVNGDEVARVKGKGPTGRPRQGRVLLKKERSYHLRLEYFEYEGQEGLAVALKKGKSSWQFSRERPKAGRPYEPELIKVGGTARIYRNFIKGSDARAIGVGYPGGVNIAYNAENLGISQAWLGDFIDAGLHWTGRGKGSQDPAGQRVLKWGNEPLLARLSGDFENSWPEEWQEDLQPQFEGYRLDDKRRPEFHATIEGLHIFDRPEAVRGRELVRTIRLRADSKLSKGLALMLSGRGAKRVGSHRFDLGNGVQLQVAKCGGVKPELFHGRVILRLNLERGEQRVGTRYLWK